MSAAGSNAAGGNTAGGGDSVSDGSINPSDDVFGASSPGHGAPQPPSYASGAATLIRNHWKAIARNISAIVATAASIFVMAERSKRGFDDVLWRSLWCFSTVWSCLLCFFWSRMLKSPNAFFFMAIILGFFVLTKLLEGTELLFDDVLPALPLGIISGSFMSYLYLSPTGYVRAGGRNMDVEQVWELGDIDPDIDAPPVAAPVTSPAAAPVAAPTTTSDTAPVAAPAAPVAAPDDASVAAPVASPVATPIAAPDGAPVTAHVAASVAAPVAAPVVAPVAAPGAGT